MKKHYILKRSNQPMIDDYLMDMPTDKRGLIKKRLNNKLGLLLIEKTTVKDDIGTSEHYTNMWTVSEGIPANWGKHTKGRIMWDYTGIVYPLIHINNTVLTFDQYCENKNKQP